MAENNKNHNNKNTDHTMHDIHKQDDAHKQNDEKKVAGKDVSITSPETAMDKIAGAFNSVMPNDDDKDDKDHKSSSSKENRDPKYVLTIDEGVVEKISSLAAQKVDGIVDMKGSVFSMIQEGLGGNDDKKGADADIDDGAVTVELSIILEYGKSALEVFDGIKEAVTDQVKEMTGLDLAELTVNVVDVVDKAEYDKAHNNGDGSESEKRTAVTLSQQSAAA